MLGLAVGIAGSGALSGITKVIYGMYGATGAIGTYFDEHISGLKASDNAMVSQTGTVLEGAKTGFGIGYMSSVIVIALGQYMLGNTLSAVVTAGTAATFTNPVAMTCAAVGAIYYGWGALGTAEKDAILDRITRGLEIGVELIKSVVQFLILKTNELMSSQSLAEFKALVREYAGQFGKTLYDVTGKMADYVQVVTEKASELTKIAAAAAVGGTSTAVRGALDKTSTAAAAAADSTSLALQGAYQTTGDAASSLANLAKQKLGWKTPDAALGNTQASKSALAPGGPNSDS